MSAALADVMTSSQVTHQGTVLWNGAFYPVSWTSRIRLEYNPSGSFRHIYYHSVIGRISTSGRPFWQNITWADMYHYRNGSLAASYSLPKLEPKLHPDDWGYYRDDRTFTYSVTGDIFRSDATSCWAGGGTFPASIVKTQRVNW